MNYNEKKKLYGFYQNELSQNLLGFWLPRCEDKEYGGFLNCFDNAGEKLASYDKYTWSQGRFVWIFSRLAGTPIPMFSDRERSEFLRLAQQGAEFLMKHCLIAPGDWRCVFLMERDGKPKEVTPGSPPDMSIYADCFAVLGLGMYASVSRKEEAYVFAKKLYASILERVGKNQFNTLPYPLSHCYRAHGIPMILDNTARELLRAAEKFDMVFAEQLKKDMKEFCLDELEHFVDKNNVLHEIITEQNIFFPQILGQHMNPGHTIEDAWFMLDTASICGIPEIKEKIFDMTKKALQNGWDDVYGGLLHFCGVEGGEPNGDYTGVENETMTKQLMGWGDKLWWIHSEALYTTLRCYFESGDEEFLAWHEKVFEYTFQTFPNRDPNIREWKQIRRRDGTPEEKVVALPVKDPFHIMRNMILILELLYNPV
ncbi:MAG: AGE family epimerase/isomerase [Oscillospiraceae bacterium]|nr:AGE family epimerase/isomerase [Oscillospiraceae bacterium]